MEDDEKKNEIDATVIIILLCVAAILLGVMAGIFNLETLGTICAIVFGACVIAFIIILIFDN